MSASGLHLLPLYGFASKGEFASTPKMDRNLAEQVLDELFPSFEALETQSAAIVQFLKGKGIATDEQLAPYFEQAKNASSVRWHAARIRMERLLSTATKTVEQATEKGPAEPAQKASEKAGNAAAETVHGKEPKKEGDPANKTAKDIASSTEKNGGENNGRKKAGSGEQQGKEAA